MKRLFLPSISFLALFSLLISAPSAQETKTIYVTPKIEKELGLGSRYALIIGIGKYKDKRIPTLSYTVADAKAMHGILTDPRHGRFRKDKVRLLLDEEATAEAIRKGFTWLRRNVKAEDTVIIFYSGHGGPEEKSIYWVTFDADIDDLSATAIGNDFITQQLSEIQAKRLITFLDSCYSAAIVEKKDKPKALFDQDFFSRYRGEGRVTITASDGKELSLESKELGHGVFTYYLVEALKGKADRNQDGAVELEEVWDHVKQRVTDEAQKRGNKQRPNLIGKMTAGLLVSLNPGVLETEKARLEGLKKLFLKREISGPEYEEAEQVLGGEGEARLLDLVRRLADGKVLPTDYRFARAGILGGRPAEVPKPPEKRERPSPPAENLLALLDKADSQFLRRRYTSPKGDNAYETIQEVLRLDPRNERALKKLQEIAETYRRWGKEDFEKKNFARARQSYQKVLSIFPEDRGAQEQLAAIERAEREGGEARTREDRERREAEARAERERLSRLEQEKREREQRERRGSERLEQERRRLQEERARLERERELRKVEGVWRAERTGQAKTTDGKPFTRHRTRTLTLRVEGSTVRGFVDLSHVETLPPPEHWGNAFNLQQSCGNVNRRTMRQHLEGTVLQAGVVSFTTKPGEIIEDSCSYLRKNGPDSLQPPGAYRVELSADGLSISLDQQWHEVYGGGQVVLKKGY